MGCSFNEGPLQPANSSDILPSAFVARERQLADMVARELASLLSQQAMRRQLKDDFRLSGATYEHKLLLSNFLQSSRTQLSENLKSRLQASGVNVEWMRNELRELEIYMPIRQHRRTWMSHQPVQVAWQLEQGDQIVAYNSSWCQNSRCLTRLIF